MNAADLKALLEREGFHPDNGIATHLLAAQKETGLPLSDCLALIEQESGFRNVFGHDNVRNPIKGGKVSLWRYKAYKAYRKRGWGCQGVGPAQLTWYEYQDEADELGGCHKPFPNMVVGFRLMKAIQKTYGREKGAAVYNGGAANPNATYGREYLAKQTKWHKLVA